MKNKFTRHVPSFCDGIEQQSFEFDTLDEMLSHEFCVYHEDCDNFAKSEQGHILALYDGGKKWYCIGRVTHPELIALPIWSQT